MNDATENIRREQVTQISQLIESDDRENERKRLIGVYGADNVWDTQQLSAKFEVLGFMAPYCVVKDKATGKKGGVQFQHAPRFYFNYQADS